MSRTISVADLERLGAGQSQIDRFRATFDEADDGVAVTMANVLVAGDAGLHLGWIAQGALTTHALRFYDRVKALTREEYERIHNSAWTDYEHAKALAEEDPRVNVSLAWAEFRRATDQAWEERERIIAMAWVAAYEASAVENRKGDD